MTDFDQLRDEAEGLAGENVFTAIVDAIEDGGGGGSVVSVVAGANIAVDPTDPANPIVAVTSPIALNDGSFDRAVLADDGSGLTLTDAAGQGRVELNDSEGLYLFDGAAVNRVTLFSDGTGLELFDASGNHSSVLTEDTLNVGDSSGATGPRWLMDTVGDGLQGYDATPQSRVALNVDGTGLVLTDAAGNPQQQIGDAAIGFFAATPVAQQATPVTLGDVIALLQAYGLSA